MATIPTPAPPKRTSAPIGGIQPGGGFCLSLEQLWGQCRRAWLRRFFPGYVKRMAQLRQGQCPNCPHDIIDSRDLKLVRNVCGYRFAPEQDPYAWRGRLGLARPGLAELVCFSLVFLAVSLVLIGLGLFLHPLWFAGLALIVPLWGFIFAFFRDPERSIPADPAVLVSPADGTVTHVEEVDDPDFPGGRVLRVSIFLSVFNVHVNRVPRTGRVVGLHYYPGTFCDARNEDCHARNEQFWIDLIDQATQMPIRVKQIAGAIARRIVCWLKPGEEVTAGERCGMIKFGSRTDVLLPASAVAEVCVRVGETVQGGGTVLLRLR